MRRSWGPIIAILVLAGACSDAGGPDTSAATTTSTTAVGDTTTTSSAVTTTTTFADTTTTSLPEADTGALALGDDCAGFSPLEPFGAQLTFVVDGRLHAYDGTGTDAPCLLEVGSVAEVRWGPRTDQVLVDGAVFTAEGPAQSAITAAEASFSRPTGKSLLTITDGGASLVKGEIGTGDIIDLSFLARHDEASYYPSGTHIGVIGEDAGGEYGVWMVDNLGDDPVLIVDAGEGVTVSSIRFSNDVPGQLTFVADHGDDVHLHEISILTQEGVGQVVEFDATILLQSSRSLAPAPSSFGFVAATEGSCDDGGTTARLVIEGTEAVLPDRLQAVDTQAVMLLRDQFIVAAFPNGCGQGPAELWSIPWTYENGLDAEATLLASGVDIVAPRIDVGDAPFPPPTDGFAGFA